MRLCRFDSETANDRSACTIEADSRRVGYHLPAPRPDAGKRNTLHWRGPMRDYDPRLKKPMAGLTLAALGVVYGDIGTSPLYAAKETFNPDHGIPLNTSNVLGGLSAIFWALMIVVSLKYVILIMRAHNKGEGGIMALLALASSAVKHHPRSYAFVLLAGVFGASLFYGDAVLTPAISVLSGVEGLEVGMGALKTYGLPIFVGVVVGIFGFLCPRTSL